MDTVEDVRAVLFDLDVIDIRELGRESLDTLRGRGIDVRFITNDCTLGTDRLLDQIRSLDIPVAKDELFPASRVLAMEIARKEIRATVYLLGSDGFYEDMQAEGLRVIENPEEIDYLADYVVVGHDETFSYTKLTNALRCLDHGAKWAVTDDRVVLNVDDDLFPGPGVIKAAIETMANRPPDFQLGQPRPHLLHRAIKSTAVAAEHCVWVGDPTDASGKRATEYGVGQVLTQDDLTLIFPKSNGTSPASSPADPSSTYQTEKSDPPRA